VEGGTGGKSLDAQKRLAEGMCIRLRSLNSVARGAS
jgi:hypothetical protein